MFSSSSVGSTREKVTTSHSIPEPLASSPILVAAPGAGRPWTGPEGCWAGCLGVLGVGSSRACAEPGQLASRHWTFQGAFPTRLAF